MVQEGCEFLVAQGSDGRLNLDDVYVYDQETGIYARPDKVGDMPPGPRLFQQVVLRTRICLKLWMSRPPLRVAACRHNVALKPSLAAPAMAGDGP